MLVAVFATLWCLPVYGQSEETTYEKVTDDNKSLVTENNFEELLKSGETIPVKKYTTTAVNIRQDPNTSAAILGTSRVNTEIEIVLEIEGWSMITTEGGYAYMKSDWFSDEPVVINHYSDEDLRILAMILCGECQTYPDEEQRLVGSVFLNRVKSNQFPNTFKGVAADRRWGIQYACWYDGNAFREIQESNWKNAKWLLENGSILPDYVLYQSGSPIGKTYLKTDYHYYGY